MFQSLKKRSWVNSKVPNTRLHQCCTLSTQIFHLKCLSCERKRKKDTYLYPMSSNFLPVIWDLWMLKTRSKHSFRPVHFGSAVWWMTTLWAGPFRCSHFIGAAAPHWVLEMTVTEKQFKMIKLYTCIIPISWPKMNVNARVTVPFWSIAAYRSWWMTSWSLCSFVLPL